MQKQIQLNNKYHLVVWHPWDSDKVNAFLLDRSTGFQMGAYTVIAFTGALRTLDLIRVSDTEAQVKVNDTVVTVLVKETSITVAS